MKTPYRQNKIKINYNLYHSSKQLNKCKNKKPDIKKELLFDEIELKTQLIKAKHKNLKKIKIDTIKELVYANKNVPEKWKSKREYPTQVFGLLSNDEKFLNYLGSKGELTNNDNIEKSNQSIIYDLTNNNNYKLNNIFIKNKNKNFSIITEYNKNNKNLNNYYCYTTPKKNRYNSFKDKVMNEKEIINILDELQMNYPIKEKIYELYPEEAIKKIKIKNALLDKKKNNKLNILYPIITSRKIKEGIKNNIFVNLITSYNKNAEDCKNDKNEGVHNKFIDDYDIDLLTKRKEMIKSPIANKYLERINFYGPYYSYCPSCGIRNIKFYQKLQVNNLIKFTNVIKKYRNKK